MEKIFNGIFEHDLTQVISVGDFLLCIGVLNRYKNGGMYGLPVKLWYAAACDQEPIDAITASYLENDILGCAIDIYNRPLISSNTLSGGEVEGEAGRPESEEPSESTVANIEANDNYK